MSLINEYICDAPSCEERVAVDSEEAKDWLVLCGCEGDDGCERHYCSWKCLSEDAEVEAEAEAEAEEENPVAKVFSQLFNALKRWKEKEDEISSSELSEMRRINDRMRFPNR